MDNAPLLREPEAESPPALADLPLLIKRGIGERTHGRVRELSVETTGDRLIVRGCVNSCHVKQLALEAVIDASDSLAIELDIRVERSRRARMDDADGG